MENGSSSSIVYIDTSALIKLVIDEPETDPLREELAQWQNYLASELVVIELFRSVRKFDIQLLEIASNIATGLSLSPITRQITALASTIEPVHLRSLEAIHLATALMYSKHLDAFITYDRRLCEAAKSVGIKVLSPT